MIDWIQVLLGLPLEEEREDGLEELNQAAGWIISRQSRTERGSEDETDEGADGALAEADQPGTGQEWGTDREKMSWTAANDGLGFHAAEDGGKAEEKRQRKLLRQGTPAEEPFRRKEYLTEGQRSAGKQTEALEQREYLAWKSSGLEELTAVTAQGQAERAAAQAERRHTSSSTYLEAALSAPPVTSGSAGRLLKAMERNDQAMTYQTALRQTEQEENTAWTGTDPIRLDRLFERDARRYDNGFAMY